MQETHAEPQLVIVLISVLLCAMGIVAGITALIWRNARNGRLTASTHAQIANGSQPPRWRTWSLAGVAFGAVAALGVLIGAWWAAKARDAEFQARATWSELVLDEHEKVVFEGRSIPEPPPEWVHLAENRTGRTRTVVLVSLRASSVEKAERDVATAALSRTLAYLREIEPQRGSWNVSAEMIERHAFGRRHIEEIHENWRRPREFRVYRELRLAPELAALVPSSPSPAPLPEWAKAERDADNEPDSRTLLLVSRQYATVEEAEEELLGQAANRVRERFHAVHPPVKGWDVPEESVRAMYSPRRHVEELERSSGEHTFRVHRVYRELHIPADLAEPRGELYGSWRRAVVERRLRRIGGGVAVGTFALFLASLGLRRTRRRSDDTPGESRRGGGTSIGVTMLAVIVVLASVAILHPAALLIGVMMLAVIVVLALGFAVVA